MRKLEIECMLLFLALVAVPAHQLNQGQTLTNFLKARRSQYTAEDTEWTPSASTVDIRENETVHYVQSQKGMRERDLIKSLPGQPADVSFRQYSGYVTVDPSRGRALFYWFVEATRNPSQKPLVLWLNGGPGCSSMIGALLELGPFRVNPDGKTLYTNPYAWNKVANVLFLETPAGVGFSYSNTTADYNRTGDRLTSQDSFTFLLNWFGRFPEYKSRPFYITGESYAGYYIPELADQILTHKRLAQASGINFKGVMIGNGLMNSVTDDKGYYDYLWTHALNSDQTHEGILKYCNFFPSASSSKLCFEFSSRSNEEEGNIDYYNIYAPLCHDNNSSRSQSSQSRGGVYSYDPCSENYLYNYLNLPEVQRALHANVTNLKYAWDECSDILLNWTDNPSSILPIIRRMIAARLRILIYSGDVDSVVPVTGTRYGINALHLPIEMPWRPWTSAEEVAGYTVTYKGLTFATVRGAGHEVPSYQPERSLTMTKYFLLGKPLPASSTA